MINVWKKIVLSLIIFVALCLLEIYLNGFFVVRPIIDFVLLYLIILVFFAPLWLVILLVILKGLIFDSLLGINWGINLISLLISFIFGYYLLTRIDKESFFARLMIGSLMIIFYFSVFEVLNIFVYHNGFQFLIIIDLLINLLAYLLGNFIYVQIKK
jgi:rod shape-determining protein MreD